MIDVAEKQNTKARRELHSDIQGGLPAVVDAFGADFEIDISKVENKLSPELALQVKVGNL